MEEDSALGQLIGAYLNQDLFDFYPDVMAGVDDFCAVSPDLALNLPHEIDRLLDSEDDSGITRVLTSLGVGFVAGDITYREWLTQIADRVRAATT